MKAQQHHQVQHQQNHLVVGVNLEDEVYHHHQQIQQHIHFDYQMEH
jgi:hypothetical protein